MTDLDLRDAFESSFGPEPPLPSPDSTVRAGRSALMRRNLGITGTTVAVAAVALLGATQLGGDPTAAPGPVGKPTPTPTVSEQQRLTDATDVDSRWQADCGHAGQPGCARYTANAAPVGLRGTDLVRSSNDVQISSAVVDDSPPAGVDYEVAVEALTPASIHPEWWTLIRTGSKVEARLAVGHSMVDFPTFAQGFFDRHPAQGAPRVTRTDVVAGD